MFDHPAFDAHEGVHFFHDEKTGLRAIIAIHSSKLGPAAGGCRMWNYTSSDEALKDALRLSQGMSYKNAMAGLPLGGGKSVIWGNARTDKSPELFQAFGRAVNSLAGAYYTAEDVGVSPADMAQVRTETRFVAGLNEGRAASGDPSPVTAEGVYRGIRVALGHAFGNDDPKNRRVAVQGVGHVGADVVRKLAKAGAEVVIADIATEQVEALARETGAHIGRVESILFEDVDVLSPCALGAVLNAETLPQLKCKVIAGAANNQLASPEIGDRLFDMGIIYAPDYVINGGGIINVAAEISGTYEQKWVVEKLDALMDTLNEVFELSSRKHHATNRIADAIARHRIGRC